MDWLYGCLFAVELQLTVTQIAVHLLPVYPDHPIPQFVQFILNQLNLQATVIGENCVDYVVPAVVSQYHIRKVFLSERAQTAD